MGWISTLRPGLLALFAVAFALAAPYSAAATQVVFLDFVTLGGSNINHPADGTYFLKAFASPLAFGSPPKTGDYELFGYRFAAVPEPSTTVLLALGLAGLALRVHRSRARTRQAATS